MLKGLSYIGNERAEQSPNPFRAENRSTGEILEPDFHSCSSEETELAVSLASQASAPFRNTSGHERAAFLRAIADCIDSAASEIVPRYIFETALPEGRARGELARTTGQLRLFAELVQDGSWVDARIETALPDRQPIPKPDMRTMARALGPVAVFGASNFPLAFSAAGGDTASALAAGCPVIVKAHPAHPGVSEIVADCIIDAVEVSGMPNGVFSLLFDRGYEVGATLVGHPSIKGVGFTGSQRGGLALVQIANARPVPIPVFAEMGSVNPTVLLPQRLREDCASLAQSLFVSVTLGAGQFCTNPGLLFTIGDSGSFEDALTEQIRSASSCPMLTQGIASAYEAGIERLRDTPGVETLASVEHGPALFATDAATFELNPHLREEVFGPCTILVRVEDERAAIKLLTKLPGQLTVSFQGTPQDFADHRFLIHLAEEIAGRILFNQMPTGLEVCAATVHGGPFPATSDGRSTSVGTLAINRWTRPVCWQNADDSVLPPELQTSNPLKIRRMLNGEVGVH